MSDVLLFEGYTADGLPTLSVDTSSGVYLAPGFDFGALVLSGALMGRYADKVWSVPLMVKGTTRAAVRALVEGIVLALSRPAFSLTWTPEGGLPIVFDCRDAQVTHERDLLLEQQGWQQVSVTFTTAPHGKTPEIDEPLAGTVTAGTRYTVLAPEDVIGSAPGLVTDMEVVGTDLVSTLVYVAPAGRPACLPIPATLAFSDSFHDQFEALGVTLTDVTPGTYSMFVSLSEDVGSGGTLEHELLFEITERLALSGVGIGFTNLSAGGPSKGGRLLAGGTLTLPLSGSLTGGRTYDLKVNTSASGTGPLGGAATRPQVQDFILVSTDGSVLIFSAGTHGYVAPPQPDRDMNVTFSSSTSPYRDHAVSAGQIVSGPPLQVAPNPGEILVHTPDTAAPTFTATYQPRWLSERTE